MVLIIQCQSYACCKLPKNYYRFKQDKRTFNISLAKNLAKENPEKLKEMQALFMKEAEKHHVLPIDDRLLVRNNTKAVGRPVLLGNRTSVNYVEGMRGLGVDIFIDLRNTSYTTTAQVEIDANGKGVIICQGGRFGGLTFYLKDGKPAFCYNFLGLESTTIVAPTALKPGKHTLVYNFTYDGGGIDKGGNMTISVDGNQVAEGKLARTQQGIFSVDDLADVGLKEGTQITNYGG